MKREIIEGKLQGNERGYAFLIASDGRKEDYFIPHQDLKGAMHGDTVLADAFAAQKSSGRSQRMPGMTGGQMGQRGAGSVPGAGSMPGADSMPGRGEMPQAGGMNPTGNAPEAERSAEKTGYKAMLDTAKTKALALKDKLMAWLYEGVETGGAQQVTGSLVPVETGLKNDDHVEILSGLNEGDVVLYTATESSSSSRFGGMGGMMGGGMMGGMGGRR